MKWRHNQCKDSKDSIDIIWLTLLITNRLILLKTRCGIRWYLNRPWLMTMTMAQSSIFTSIGHRLGKVFLYLCYFVNCFLASKPSNGFQSKTVTKVLIYYGWFTWWSIDMTFITSHFQVQLSLCSTQLTFKHCLFHKYTNILWVCDILKMAVDIARILTACMLRVHIPASLGFMQYVITAMTYWFLAYRKYDTLEAIIWSKLLPHIFTWFMRK